MTKPSTSETPSLRDIPSVDQLLRTEPAVLLRASLGAERLAAMAREVTDGIRADIRLGALGVQTKDELLKEAGHRLEALSGREASTSLHRVINATGVILHTNLGRAPLSDAARRAVSEASGYCTLEYDVTSGSRGKRGGYAEDLLKQLTGAESALVVNNCASAALLILTVLARDSETIVSRGELVEIGGDFRVPEVMANSGTRMVEIGSTNRTRLEDYERAITGNTRLIMRVHPSNYRIIGFTTAPALSELAKLAHDSGLLLYEDAGSGALVDLSHLGLGDEPTVSASIEAGADVVSFSGDKLLGGPQAGLIVGRGEVVERLRKHSLYRALRADKLCLAALEATLESHRRGALDEIPALRRLGVEPSVIEERAQKLIEQIANNKASGLNATTISGQSAVGGGSGPNVHPPTSLIALSHNRLSAENLESMLRRSSPPVIARIADDQVLLDLRTVGTAEEPELLQALLTLSH